jgi:hypothetical protein
MTMTMTFANEEIDTKICMQTLLTLFFAILGSINKKTVFLAAATLPEPFQARFDFNVT